MIPLEVITMLGSTLVGAIAKIWGMKAERDKMQMDLLMQKFSVEQSSREKALEGPSQGKRGFQWTRRVIALATVFSVIVLPKIAALAIIWGDIPPSIIYGYVEETSKFLWFGDSQVLRWHVINGIPITPLDTHLVSAITGLYFGGSLTGHNK
jgi:hypothetical protein